MTILEKFKGIKVLEVTDDYFLGSKGYQIFKYDFSLKKYDFFEKSACIFENNLILYTSRVRQAAKTKYMRKCRNWQTSKTKDLVIIAIVWVQVPSSAL